MMVFFFFIIIIIHRLPSGERDFRCYVWDVLTYVEISAYFKFKFWISIMRYSGEHYMLEIFLYDFYLNIEYVNLYKVILNCFLKDLSRLVCFILIDHTYVSIYISVPEFNFLIFLFKLGFFKIDKNQLIYVRRYLHWFRSFFFLNYMIVFSFFLIFDTYVHSDLVRINRIFQIINFEWCQRKSFWIRKK